MIMNHKISDFAQLVYEKTKLIPKGKVTTYKLLAQAIGKPGASQAVGTALSNNPFAPIVPCHRVLPSNGSIGGFYKDTDP
jgi:methylated-DNA-[protein]-cysteine S-methyltransferase